MASDEPYNSQKAQRCLVISVSVNRGPHVCFKAITAEGNLGDPGPLRSPILQRRHKHSGNSLRWILTVDETFAVRKAASEKFPELSSWSLIWP